MSDILIKNMKIPEDCRNCPFEMYYMNCGETRCRATGKILADFYKPIPFEGRAEECPLVEVPTPHGRLIDADALERRAKRTATEAWKMKLTAKVEATMNQFIDWVKEAPTIIEAEG